MITKRLFRSALHEHAEPAQRVLGVLALPPDSDQLAHLVASDSAPEVRTAAAQRCTDLPTLAAAWQSESDATVRDALAAALTNALSEAPDHAAATALLDADHCSDAIRSQVARRTSDAELRRVAIAGIRAEDALVDLALAADHAETRMAAAARVQTPEGLRRLADAARNKDRGVARHARQQIDAIDGRLKQAAEADAILVQQEALIIEPGAILTAMVELDRRWQALGMSGDTDRSARWDAARQSLHARFAREHEVQRIRARFDGALRAWVGSLTQPTTEEALAQLHIELAALREEAQGYSDGAALSRLDDVGRRLVTWARAGEAHAAALELVVEAEQLAATTSIDAATLPERWQALDRAMHTPELTQRFEIALVAIEQRRLARIRAGEQEASAARQQVHGLLHAAEQALTAGQLQVARAAADDIRKLKASAGLLPKPTVQRLSRLVQQLVELERWESFGQHQARIQLCERAEAVATQTLDARQLALDVRRLRDEWKALDEQHAGVPKSLWERFDRACEKAYAPAARYFAELAAQRKEARKAREEFIVAAAAHVEKLLGEPRDWRAIERWLRETDQTWRDGDLGSVEPATWKKLDARLSTAVAPLRAALSASREQAKTTRQALIAEATALAAKAMDRDAPSQVKAIQARWQEQARLLPLPQRDERVLWEQFRAACDSVFAERQSKRKQEDGRKHESRRALEDLCTQLEQLALATDKDDAEIRRVLRDLQEQWKKAGVRSDPALRGVESRFRSASAAVESMLSARVRSREGAVWLTLAAKELLCEELDRRVGVDQDPAEVAATPLVHDRWAALPALPAAWEKKMVARRDAALAALSDHAVIGEYIARIKNGVGSRRECLLELESALSLDSPAEFQAHRLALQVKRLRDRFSSAATSNASTAPDLLLAWCATPGVADARDRQRCERVMSKIEHV